MPKYRMLVRHVEETWVTVEATSEEEGKKLVLGPSDYEIPEDEEDAAQEATEAFWEDAYGRQSTKVGLDECSVTMVMPAEDDEPKRCQTTRSDGQPCGAQFFEDGTCKGSGPLGERHKKS